MFDDILETQDTKEIKKIYICNYIPETIDQCPGFQQDMFGVCKYLDLDGRICLWKGLPYKPANNFPPLI